MALDAARWLPRLRDPSDRVAAGAFAAESFPHLVRWLRAKHRWADDHLIQEAAGSAVVDFLKDPGRYDARRRSLAGYLRMAAAGDLLNLHRRERRHCPEGRIRVELDELAGNSTVGGAP